MSCAYTPQPGTIAARAVAAVLALGKGETIANVVLAERLGQASSFVIAGMEAPVRYGLIERVMNGRNVSWRRGDGTPKGVLLKGNDEPDDAPPVQRIVKAEQGGVELPDVPRWPGLDTLPPAPAPTKRGRKLRAEMAHSAPPPVGAPPPTPLIVPYRAKPSPAALRVALWSDGQLQIQRGDFELILLAPDETRELVKYLERMAEASE